MQKSRCKRTFTAGAAFALTLNGLTAAMAQQPAAPIVAPSTTQPTGGAQAPIPNVLPPITPKPPLAGVPTVSVAPVAAPTTAGTPVTLSQVVAAAVNSNSAVILAEQELQKAQYGIDATRAQALPQVTASIVDTYNSQKGYGTSGTSAVGPSLPGGGEIPTIIDQGGGTTSTFIGGGGGGTAQSTGSGASSESGTSTTLSPTVTGGGISSGAAGTSTSGTPSGGTSGTGAGSASGGESAQAVEVGSLPPIMQEFAEAEGAPIPSSNVVSPGALQASAEPRAPAAGGTATETTQSNSGSSGQNNNYSGRIGVTQYIDLFGLVPAALDVEKMTQGFYQLNVTRVKNETALTAKEDFFTVLRDKAQVAVDQEQVNAAAANLHFTQVQYQAGTAAPVDVYNAAVTLSNDEQTERTDQNTLNLADANLDNLLGVPASTVINLQAPAVPSFSAAVDLERSTQIALAQRPEIQQANNNVVIAQKLVRLAGASILPSLGISADANYAGHAEPGVPQDDYTISADLNIPVFDGGYAHSEVQSAKVDLQTQETTRTQLEQNVTLEVKQAYLDILTDQARAETAAVGAADAEEAARIARLQYQYGATTYVNVLTAEAQLATAETDELNADFSYQTDLATLVRDIGGR